MRYLSTLLLTAGLVSAVDNAVQVVQNAPASGAADLSSDSAAAADASQQQQSAQGLDIASLLNSTGQIDSGAGLGQLNVPGLDLNSVNLGDQNSVVNAILLMMNALCLGQVLDANSLLALGGLQDLELMLELGQLMQLEQLGFVNVAQIASLFGGSSSIGSFNLISIKRDIDGLKKNMKRSKLRRIPLAKRQCPAGTVVDPNAAAAATGAASVAAPSAAAAPAADPAVATAAPAVAPVAAPAAAPAAADPAPASSADNEPLSDFSR